METKKNRARNQTYDVKSTMATLWAKHKERVAKKKEKEKNKPLAQKIMSWILTLLGAVVVALLVRAYIAEPIRVDGTSMTNPAGRRNRAGFQAGLPQQRQYEAQ